jgi:hypothetical protein
MNARLTAILACAAALVSGPLAAQGTEELLTSVGTTVTQDGTHHAYLLWQPGDAAATLGKRFAIHRKSGPADSPLPFTRLGIQTLQTSANTIRAMLELGVKIDRAAAAAPTRIDGLYREITLRTGEPPAAPPDPNLDAAGKLAFLIQSAVTDPRTLSRLFFLGRAHPGVMMALGHAFSIPVKNGVHTFEIREVDSADNDVRVVGRITVDTAAPVVLQAPSSPVRVLHPVTAGSQHTISPKDHLNARLRWGASPTLRSQMPHSFGFDLFRVARETAVNLGWHLTPPTPQEIVEALAATDPADPAPAISQANELPILIGDLLTPAQAADPADTERIDFADDGIWHRSPEGQSIRRPYADGEAFYYFVAARTITGAPGLLSSGALVTMCHRLPPRPASIQSVLSNFVRPANPADWAAQGGSQFLQVKIRQLPSNPAAERPLGYYVHRWATSQEYLDHLGNPNKNRIGYIAHSFGDTYITFNDNGAGAPTLASHTDRSVWYTIRAVGASKCEGQVLSGHSAPMAGYLRDFRAPDGPTGDFLICNHQPRVVFIGREEKRPENYELPEGYTGIVVEAVRTTNVITAALIEVELRQPDRSWLTVHSRRHIFQRSDVLIVPLPYREPDNEVNPMRIRVSAITAQGTLSDPLERIVIDGKKTPFATHRYSLSAEMNCKNVSNVPGTPTHEAYLPGGFSNPIVGTILFPAAQGVAEWRVYRRVGADGDLSLIAKGEGAALPNPSTWTDDALPLAPGTSVCYFGQVFDQNANPSPLTLISCVTLLNPELPTPMLSPAEIIDNDDTHMTLQLEWFCDPAGVDRFEVLIAREGGGDPAALGLSPLLSPVALESVSSDFPDLAFYRYQTPRVGATMGNGPGFGIQVRTPADARVYFAVRACSVGEPDARASGSASNVVSNRFLTEDTGPQPVIPWPARPLPGVFDQRRPIGSFPALEGPFWPVVLPTSLETPTGILVGLTRGPLEVDNKGKSGTFFSLLPPEHYLFRLRETKEGAETLATLMPFMLYRYQVPSVSFPNARPNLVQCTPLLDRMSWNFINDPEKGGTRYQFNEPYFHILNYRNQIELPVAGNWSDSATPTLGDPGSGAPLPPYLEGTSGMILVKDPLPVTIGAKYRHIIVKFDNRGEIQRVIPLDPVQH